MQAMKKLLPLFLFSFFHTPCNADNFSGGARSMALGTAGASLSDVWSTVNNQAGLAFLKNFSAASYLENHFLLKELSYTALALALPVKRSCFGFIANRFGYSLYSENKLGISFAKELGPKLSAGVQLDYFSIRIGDNYGNKSLFCMEAGIQSKPLKGLCMGLHVFNPTHARVAQYNNERLPVVVRFAMHYEFSDLVTVLAETRKNSERPLEFKAGIEYKFFHETYLRVGISTLPALSSFGFGVKLKTFRLDVSTAYHYVLGFNSGVGLTYIP